MFDRLVCEHGPNNRGKGLEAVASVLPKMRSNNRKKLKYLIVSKISNVDFFCRFYEYVDQLATRKNLRNVDLSFFFHISFCLSILNFSWANMVNLLLNIFSLLRLCFRNLMLRMILVEMKMHAFVNTWWNSHVRELSRRFLNPNIVQVLYRAWSELIF